MGECCQEWQVRGKPVARVWQVGGMLVASLWQASGKRVASDRQASGMWVASKWQASLQIHSFELVFKKLQLQNHVDGASFPQPFQNVENGVHVGKQVAIFKLLIFDGVKKCYCWHGPC